MNIMQKNRGQIYPLFSKVVYGNIIDDLNFKKIVKNINDDFIDAGHHTKSDVSNISMASQNKNVYFIDHFFKTKTKLWADMRICRWLPGDAMSLHNDRSEKLNDLMDFSSLIYLNDNYEGGELFFKDKIIKMKALSCIVFQSNEKNMHGVLEIKKGKRYTIPSWYQFN